MAVGSLAHAQLLLVDGHHFAYRSFHALPASLSAPDGTPTGALLGFVRSLQALRAQWRPTHLAVVFDGGVPASRVAVLPEYKAQRPPMPESLSRQLALIEEYLTLAGIPAVRREGEESDDVLATLAEKAAADGASVLIATGDKDLMQLVNERIRVIRPDAPDAAMGREEVAQLFGVPAERLPELLALTGDAVDNVPGVGGVGPKTAQRLLSAARSLDELWTKLDEVAPPALRERLRAARPIVERNLAIVRLRRDVPGLPVWAALTPGPARTEKLREFLMRYGLRSLVPQAEQRELF
ncbi:MAG: flap endonuclease [Kiritimatiellae bacterium]|nr:flap endonuclease [Kiritimatiellia bacterium]